jgi:hypothetical protein
MKINVNHPSFISFIDKINQTVMTHSPVDAYFGMTLDKKMSSLYIVFKLLKNTLNLNTKLSDDDLKSFIQILCKKNEEYENYEFAAILKDILNNFDVVNEFSKTKKKQNKTIKVDKSQNG